jgi:hypothetical protein|tara:strand:- start:105 stop:755 length:651 start_codon:yes stop_codon:yes gene_type:complete
MTNKKITIGIYGDSFSDPNWVKNNYKAWPELLETDYTIKNYSLSGTSLWWSYNKFLETCDKIDYAIFVVTIPGRLHIDYQDQHINLNPISWPVWDGVSIGEIYFKYIYSDKRETAFHNFIVSDLLLYDKILIIPAFAESIPNYAVSLCYYADKETAHYGLKNTGPNENRKCHLTKENNNMVYNKIISAMESKSKILTLSEYDYVVPKDPISQYWKV